MSTKLYRCVNCDITYSHDVWHKCQLPTTRPLPPGAGTFQPAAPLTEERVRQIVREELDKREGA